MDDLDHRDAEGIRHRRDLIGEGKDEVAIGVVDELHEFRRLGARHAHHGRGQEVEELAGAQFRRLGHAADDLRQGAEFLQRLPFQRAFRTEGEIIGHARAVEDRLHDATSHTDAHGGSQHDHVAGREDRGERGRDGLDGIEPRALVFVQRRTDGDDVDRSPRLRIQPVMDDETAFGQLPPQLLGKADFGEMGPSAPQVPQHLRRRLDASNTESRIGHGDREGEPDIAQADDADMAVTDSRWQGHGCAFLGVWSARCRDGWRRWISAGRHGRHRAAGSRRRCARGLPPGSPSR